MCIRDSAMPERLRYHFGHPADDVDPIPLELRDERPVVVKSLSNDLFVSVGHTGFACKARILSIVSVELLSLTSGATATFPPYDSTKSQPTTPSLP